MHLAQKELHAMFADPPNTRERVLAKEYYQQTFLPEESQMRVGVILRNLPLH